MVPNSSVSKDPQLLHVVIVSGIYLFGRCHHSRCPEPQKGQTLELANFVVEAMQHPMNHSRATWREIDGALQAAPAPRFSTRPDWTPRPSPKRGADTDAILAELKRG